MTILIQAKMKAGNTDGVMEDVIFTLEKFSEKEYAVCIYADYIDDENTTLHNLQDWDNFEDAYAEFSAHLLGQIDILKEENRL